MRTVRKEFRKIAVEEHFMHAALTEHFGGELQHPRRIAQRLHDFTGVRIEEMDAAGVNMQVLSHQSPGSQRLVASKAVSACRTVNDALAGIISSAPARFAGFAMIPTSVPEEAADELQRSVEELGLKGAMIHGMCQGDFADDQAYWPIFGRAERLDVPVYLHPALPDQSVTERYYAPYDRSHPGFIRAAWGFGVETGTQAVRLVLSGLFDRHPDLKVILGHLGESIPFQLDRINEALNRPGARGVPFAEVFASNFWVTTSGYFSGPALRCCLEVLGSSRILFAVDWPYADNRRAVNWLMDEDIDDPVKSAIFSGNTMSLLNIG